MVTEDMTLAAMAEIGAMRRLMVQALALRILEEDTPAHALSMLGLHLMQTDTTPSDAVTGLDPAVSDLLAAMTDERVASLVQDLGIAVGTISGGDVSHSLPI